MQEIYFHIGLHKTATTFLQKLLFPGIVDLNYIKNEKIIDELVEITQTDILTYDADKVYVSIEKHFSQGKNLISAEALSGYPFMQYMNRKDVLLKIKKSFPSAKIILGIRTQEAMLGSIYRQYIRAGGTRKSEEFFRVRKPKRGGEDPIYSNAASVMNPNSLLYSFYIEQIVEIFGKENVLIYVYEELLSDHESFVNRICRFLGVNTLKIENRLINKALPDTMYPLLRKMNYLLKTPFFEKGFIKTPQPVINKIGNFYPKKKIQFEGCSQAFQQFKRQYKEDNAKLYDLVENELKKYLDKYY